MFKNKLDFNYYENILSKVEPILPQNSRSPFTDLHRGTSHRTIA